MLEAFSWRLALVTMCRLTRSQANSNMIFHFYVNLAAMAD